ncbi:unnamed protein product, partial [Prorocentrum cordatum]
DAHAVQSSTMAAIRSAVKARADASRVAALAAKAELLQKRALAVQAKEEDAFLGLIEPVERATRAQIEEGDAAPTAAVVPAAHGARGAPLPRAVLLVSRQRGPARRGLPGRGRAKRRLPPRPRKK